MTGDAARWAVGFFWGGMLGLAYFGGLWLTLKAIVGRRQPKRWLAVSLLGRLTTALSGFWLAVRVDPGAFFFTVGAFFLVRAILTRMIGRESEDGHHATQS